MVRGGQCGDMSVLVSLFGMKSFWALVLLFSLLLYLLQYLHI